MYKQSSKLKALVKCFGFFVLVILYFITVLPLYLVYLIRPFQTRKILAEIISFYSRLTLKWLNINIVFDEMLSRPKQKNYLIISNHLSYLDILAIAAYIPTCFITSMEIKKTPVLGQICTLGGCLFVERRSRKFLGQEVSEVTQALSYGLNVVLFPEATSSNGEELLRFRRPLYKAAIASGKELLPICLNYKSVSGSELTLENRDNVFWYGDMPFLSHFLRVCHASEITVEVSQTEKTIIEVKDHDEKELADMTYSLIQQKFIPIIC